MLSIASPAPLVSVIVPAFQAAAFIRQAIDSARDQTYEPIEILVVDDGSQDETVEIVSSIAEKDPRVRIFRQFNQGVAVARNFAIAQARGEFIAPLDADDVWMPEKIEKQMRCFRQSNASVGLVYTWSYSTNQAGDTIGACPNWDLEGDVYLALLYRNFIGNASVPLIRRDHLARVGGYNAEMRALNAQGCEDWDLCLRLAEVCQFRVVPEYLVGYRDVSSSMSSNSEAMVKSYQLILEEARQRHPEIPVAILQWSRSNFFLYAAGKCYSAGDDLRTLRWLFKAYQDAAVLLCPWASWVFVMSLVGLTTRPLTRLLWPTQLEWLKFRHRLSRPKSLTRSTPPSGTVNQARPRGLRPYDRVLLRRWKYAVSQRLAETDLSRE